MVYSDLVWRGEYIQEERNRVEKEQLIAASFTAWQMLSAQVKEPMPWHKYIKGLGLVDEVPVTKDELKREADQAMRKAQDIINKATGGKDGSR